MAESTGWVVLISLIMIGAAIASVDTSDMDELCSTNNQILKRVSGTWICSEDKADNTSGNIALYADSTDFYLNSPNGNIVRYYASDGGLLGRYAETASQHSYWELYDSGTQLSVRLRSDGGDNFIYDGDLGLGTSSPDTKLDVIGEVQISDLNTGGNLGSDLCVDVNNRLCVCGSCA